MEDQIRIEYEISQLKSNNLGIGIISTKQKKEYQIEIIIPHSIIDPSIYNEDITFVIIINFFQYIHSEYKKNPYLLHLHID